jgi:hypothetical protein
MSTGDTDPKHVVILVHGIRDFALWQAKIRPALEEQGFKVEATNYGRFNLLQFLAPFSYFRRKAIATVWNQIRIIKQNNEGSRLSVIAHSFGTFVIAHLIQQQFDIKFHRVIFCGSVVRYEFPFEQFQNRFTPDIVNEVGTRDIWPAIAESVTTGYGSAGTYGFRRPLVRDRWHNGARHGFFLSFEFCKLFWSPFLRDGSFVPGADAPERPRLWVELFTIFKLKYVLVALAVLAAIYVVHGNIDTLQVKFASWLSPTRIIVPNPRLIGKVEDLSLALKTIEGRKGSLDREAIQRVSADLTATLIDGDSVVPPRVTRRQMNREIVNTLIFLNDKDLSYVWRSLPKNLDLSYLDLSGLNLMGVRFDKTFVIYTDFTDSNLDDVIFDDAYIRNVDFEGASLSEVQFIKTDWFNAVNLSADAKDGRPILYHKWLTCPRDYKSPNPRQSFIQLLEKWYDVTFDKLTPEDADQLTKVWKYYAKDNGLCDIVLRNQMK